MKLIGSTPLLQLGPNLYAKAEFVNLTGSVKDRAALSILDNAESRGLLAPGGTVIEPTSGNMGISLAALCAIRGYKAIIVMPDSMSVERQMLMKAYGAQVVLTPGRLGMAGAVEKAAQLSSEIPGSYIPGQFENPANALAHYRTTGPEIWAQTGGNVDIFVAGVGTGGTITGIGETLKALNPQMTIWAVEPENAAILAGGTVGAHLQMGIGDGLIPQILNVNIYDEICIVKDEEAIRTSKELAAKEGLMCGISSGTNVAAALRLAKKLGKGKTVVTILPDTAERYFSTPLFEDRT